MSYIKRNELLLYTQKIKDSTRIVRLNETLEKSASLIGDINVFLSHSHHDEDLIEEARLLLADQGVKCYIDRNDSNMPKKTSHETARLLKQKIEKCNKFIILASNNSLNSKWVPWELGYADNIKGLNNIAILAIADNFGQWKGSEYMGLYSTIEKSNNGNLGVFLPQINQGSTLKKWLKQ
jgi:hypothetical protein